MCLPAKDRTDIRVGCNHSLVEGIVGSGSAVVWSVISVDISEGIKAVPCCRRGICGRRGGRVLKRVNPLLSTSWDDSNRGSGGQFPLIYFSE